MSDRLSPGSSGEMVDPDGRVWTVRRKKLDLRVVRNLLRRADLPLLIGGSGGFDLRWVGAEDRADVWARIRHNYAGPGGGESSSRPDYMGYDFEDDEGNRLLYLEEWC